MQGKRISYELNESTDNKYGILATTPNCPVDHKDLVSKLNQGGPLF